MGTLMSSTFAAGVTEGFMLKKVCNTFETYVTAPSKEVSEEQLEDLAACTNYTFAVIGTLNALQNALIDTKTISRRVICHPENMRPAQAISILNKYLRENPNKLHYAPGELYLIALMLAFPCK